MPVQRGRYHSSRTRVVPVFDSLLQQDPSGRSWLSQLMTLGSRSANVQIPTEAQLIPNHDRLWGKEERRLKPHPALLRWLVRHFEGGKRDQRTSDKTRRKRAKLLKRDAATIGEALRLLKDSVVRPKWYVLEGPSQPDAYLETDTFILVIEGKRTEGEQTTTTSWMSQRNQMLRHMDAAAWDAPGGKRVFGLMIVEGQVGRPGVDYEMILSEDAISRSLPHLSPDERHSLVGGFLGMTTWQRVCQTFTLPWPPIQDDA